MSAYQEAIGMQWCLVGRRICNGGASWQVEALKIAAFIAESQAEVYNLEDRSYW